MAAPLLPNVIIIGAQKCGTTSLHHYLMQHPQIWMSREKELNFFVAEKNWPRGVDWYASHFRPGWSVRGESSPSYTDFPRRADVPRRMHALIPDAKLILVVRPPIDRIVSHYLHRVTTGREHRSLEDALGTLEGNGYIMRSRYALQLAQYLTFFPRSRVLILMQEELRGRRAETLECVFRFLDVDVAFRSERFHAELHQTQRRRVKTRVGMMIASNLGDRVSAVLSPVLAPKFQNALYRPFSKPVQRPEVTESLRQRLVMALKDDVRRFEELADRSLEHWLVLTN